MLRQQKQDSALSCFCCHLPELVLANDHQGTAVDGCAGDFEDEFQCVISQGKLAGIIPALLVVVYISMMRH